jgi:CheY-like chemotaxis protein
MIKSGPIIILEDDQDDQELVEVAIKEIGIGNSIIFLNNGEEGLKYLRTTKERPCIIISDLKMPKIDGLEFKMQIERDPTLQQMNIPFVFLTTTGYEVAKNNVYSRITVQGFFIKPANFNELKIILKTIFDFCIK